MEVVEIEYETIAEEGDDYVVFRISGAAYQISRDEIMDYDYEGRVYLERETVDRLQLEAP